MDILIVEDDRLISLLLTRLVEKMGYNVVDSVTTGEKAVEIAKKTSLDIIFMDIMLEGKIDGITAMEMIQSDKEIPALYITGNSDAMTIQRAQNTYYLDYLVKPVEKPQLERICDDFKENRNN